MEAIKQLTGRDQGTRECGVTGLARTPWQAGIVVPKLFISFFSSFPLGEGALTAVS